MDYLYPCTTFIPNIQIGHGHNGLVQYTICSFILSSFSSSLASQQLNDELRSLAGRSSPWYAGVSQELRSAKRQRRRAERRWLKTGLTVDKQIYGAAKRAVTNLSLIHI